MGGGGRRVANFSNYETISGDDDFFRNKFWGGAGCDDDEPTPLASLFHLLSRIFRRFFFSKILRVRGGSRKNIIAKCRLVYLTKKL